MFDLANAMKLAYQEAIQKKNPRLGSWKTFNILDENDDVVETVKVRYIGAGAFSQVWWDNDKRVVILIDEDECGEMTKSMLADLNAREGEQPFIPVVNALGWLPKPKGDGWLRVYDSPLYKTPLRKSDSLEAWNMSKVLIEVIKLSKQVTYNSNLTKWSLDSRYRTAATMESLDEEPPNDVNPLNWKAFCDTVAYLCRESVNYSSDWLMEASPRNLATDANGQLILLDIFFDKRALNKKHRGRC